MKFFRFFQTRQKPKKRRDSEFDSSNPGAGNMDHISGQLISPLNAIRICDGYHCPACEGSNYSKIQSECYRDYCSLCGLMNSHTEHYCKECNFRICEKRCMLVQKSLSNPSKVPITEWVADAYEFITLEFLKENEISMKTIVTSYILLGLYFEPTIHEKLVDTFISSNDMPPGTTFKKEELVTELLIALCSLPYTCPPHIIDLNCTFVEHLLVDFNSLLETEDGRTPVAVDRAGFNRRIDLLTIIKTHCGEVGGWKKAMERATSAPLF